MHFVMHFRGEMQLWIQMCGGESRAAANFCATSCVGDVSKQQFKLPDEQQVHLKCEMSFKLQIMLPDEQQAHLKWEVPAHLEWEVSMKGWSNVPVKALQRASRSANQMSHPDKGRLAWASRPMRGREQITWELRNIQSQEHFMGSVRLALLTAFT